MAGDHGLTCPPQVRLVRSPPRASSSRSLAIVSSTAPSSTTWRPRVPPTLHLGGVAAPCIEYPVTVLGPQGRLVVQPAGQHLPSGGLGVLQCTVLY